MVFKGFTDENGNIIPVQGAGTVYNEEKNSLALGKDTVATGQDQFVFGRKNIEDPNKVEVVGGGGIESIVLVSNTFDYVADLIKPICTIVYEKQYVVYKNVPVTYKVGRIVSVTSNISQLNGDTQPTVVKNMEVGKYVHIESGTNKVSFSSSADGIQSGSPLRHAVDKSILDAFGNESKNIRTLDWQGNQWNAGDVTCDDGLGNTISMRDLLSRIAALEAAANS